MKFWTLRRSQYDGLYNLFERSVKAHDDDIQVVSKDRYEKAIDRLKYYADQDNGEWAQETLSELGETWWGEDA